MQKKVKNKVKIKVEKKSGKIVRRENKKRSVAIVGGGAAGLFAAIQIATRNSDLAVTILEKTPGLLAKVRISGGGRCNLTHACFEPGEFVKNYPRGERELRGPLSRFGARDIMDWFEKHGVAVKTEPDGRVFPVSDSSESIINCLLEQADRCGVKILKSIRILEIRQKEGVGPTGPENSGFQIEPADLRSLNFDYVLLATGGNRRGMELAAALGHEIVKPVPSLFTFEVDDPRIKDIPGVQTADAGLQLKGLKRILRGPVLITHKGFSGPGILKLSALGARVLHDANYKQELRIDWRPAESREEVHSLLAELKSNRSAAKVHNAGPGDLPRRLWRNLCLAAKISEDKTWAGVSRKQINVLVEELKSGRFQIKGKGVFKEEFVTAGGVNLREVNFKTMESRLTPGLYFAGEILDIDGYTGGFNFQNAWTTAWIAGQAFGE